MGTKNDIYFDNAATTRADDDVIAVVAELMRVDYGNPSSKHMKGVEAERCVRQAREVLAGLLKVKEKEIFFTSGGTESNNLALTGVALANQRSGKHIITVKTEHDSVLKVCSHLEDEGFEVSYLDVDDKGFIKHDELSGLIREDTILVSIMYVNNETGTVHDIEAIGRLIKEKNPKTLFHVDGVQAFGKYEINIKRANIDLFSVSAHKIHGPKGVGFLYINEKVKIIPQILGGGQQKGMRSGTDNVPGIGGLSAAGRIAYENLKENNRHLFELKTYFISRLLDLSLPKDSDGCEERTQLRLNINAIDDDMRNFCLTEPEALAAPGDDDVERWILKTAPHIVSVTFEGVKSEVLLHALEDAGIYVSAGSACASNRNEVSHTLTAMGLDKKQADSTLRFSFSKYNTKEEIDILTDELIKTVPLLSRFVAR